MRIEVGPVTIVLERGDDLEGFVRGLFRFMNNKEVSELLGVSQRTVSRWKLEGLLPSRTAGQIMLLDLVNLDTAGTKRTRKERIEERKEALAAAREGGREPEAAERRLRSRGGAARRR